MPVRIVVAADGKREEPSHSDVAGGKRAPLSKHLKSQAPSGLANCSVRSSLWAGILIVALSLISHVQAELESTGLTSSTKKAYIKIAHSHATGLQPETKEAPLQMDMAQMRAAKMGLFADLRAMGDIDPELKRIIDEIDQSEDDLFTIIQEAEQLPQPPDGLLSGLRSVYYGATFQFQALDEQIKGIDDRSAEARRLVRRMLQAYDRNEAAVLMLPRIAKKLAGPALQDDRPVEVGISEMWGLQGPDQLTLVNRSGRTLHNCTVDVFLVGKAGELKQNVHFVETWPEGSPLYAHYQPGQEVLDRIAFGQTVPRIQRAEIAIFCDEFTREGIAYQYAGAERDKDIGSYLDKYFRPASGYRPFSKGLIWDDQRAVQVSFRGLQYLPPGTMAVTLKNGQLSATNRLRFQFWAASKTQWIEFRDIEWDPSEWSIQFEFYDTSVTRSYHWTP